MLYAQIELALNSFVTGDSLMVVIGISCVAPTDFPCLAKVSLPHLLVCRDFNV